MKDVKSYLSYVKICISTKRMYFLNNIQMFQLLIICQPELVINVASNKNMFDCIYFIHTEGLCIFHD